MRSNTDHQLTQQPQFPVRIYGSAGGHSGNPCVEFEAVRERAPLRSAYRYFNDEWIVVGTPYAAAYLIKDHWTGRVCKLTDVMSVLTQRKGKAVSNHIADFVHGKVCFNELTGEAMYAAMPITDPLRTSFLLCIKQRRTAKSEATPWALELEQKGGLVEVLQ